jgi:hypothetical protein
MIASRPDLAPDMVKIMRDPKTPLATVKRLVETLEVNPTRAARAAAAATATSTVRGEGQGDGTAGRLPPEARALLDQQMGLTKMKTETVESENKISFGVHRQVRPEGKAS